jgi:hypothetical protein
LALPLQESAEFWEAPRKMLPEVRVQVSPVGEAVNVKATVPVKPFTGLTVIVEFAVALA